MSERPLVADVERVAALTAPSIKTVATTFAALQRTVDTVSTDCRAVSQTLDAVGNALNMITQGAGAGADWGGFGMIGLPIMGAIRAVKGVASQYVKQQTGVPLQTWTELVANSSVRFEAYLSHLDTVARLAGRYHTPANGEIDLQQAREDEQVLLDLRWQTQAWKQILSRVAQLGQLVDAILQVNLGGDAAGAEVAETARPAGFPGSLQRRIKDVQHRTTEKSVDLREWVLQPFVEVRDRVRQLPAQTGRLAHEVALLELLLDLEIAEIRACAGEVPATEAKMVGLRVAASVTLPELAQRLADARRQTEGYGQYLDRLDRAREAGSVGERVHSILSAEYRDALADSRSRLAALQAQVDEWRRDGPAILDACADWADLELAILAARRLTEQQEPEGDRRTVLQRERARLEETRGLLTAL